MQALFFRFRPCAMLVPTSTRPVRFTRTKMPSRQLQSLLLPSALVALALIGLVLLRSELQSAGRLLVRKKKRGRLLKFLSGKDKFRKAS